MASSAALMIIKSTGKRPCLSLRGRRAEPPRVEKEDLPQTYLLRVGKNKETDPFYGTANQEYLC